MLYKMRQVSSRSKIFDWAALCWLLFVTLVQWFFRKEKNCLGFSEKFLLIFIWIFESWTLLTIWRYFVIKIGINNIKQMCTFIMRDLLHKMNYLIAIMTMKFIIDKKKFFCCVKLFDLITEYFNLDLHFIDRLIF